MPAKSNTIDEQRKIDAEAEIKAKQREVKYDLRDFTIDYIVQKFKEDFFYIPDYQRQFIWPERHQCRFIESVLLGLPIPMMFVADMEEDGRLEIVDGAQRIQTLEAFLADDLKLDGLDRLPTLNEFKYSDLPLPQQRKFGTRALRMVVLEDVTTPETRREIFVRVNTSVPARPSEVRRGAHAGRFMGFIKMCSEDSLFCDLCRISGKLRRRYEGEELVLRFFAYSERYQTFEYAVEDFLDEYVKDHKESFDRESLKAQFDSMLKFVKQHFPSGFAKSKKARTTPRVRFEAISVGVNLALRVKPDLVPGATAKWLKSEEFIKHTTTHASNSGPRLRGRVEYVRDRLLEGAR